MTNYFEFAQLYNAKLFEYEKINIPFKTSVLIVHKWIFFKLINLKTTPILLLDQVAKNEKDAKNEMKGLD